MFTLEYGILHFQPGLIKLINLQYKVRLVTEQKPEAIIEGFQEKLRTQWQQHRKQAFNANTKGAAYENALQNFLREYFGDIYNIRTRTAVVDRELKVFNVFGAGESELDVVATYKQAVPNIILQSGDMQWVPYDGVAFVSEVKSKLTASAIEADLVKLAKLNTLGRDNISNRFNRKQTGITQLTWPDEDGNKQSRNVTINHQIKCLVYDKSSISGERLYNTLCFDTEVWDLVLIVDEELLLISPELPFVEGWYRRTNIEGFENESEMFPEILVLPEGIVWFILLLSISIPRPLPFDATQALIQLIQREWSEDAGKYNEIVGSWDELFL